MFILILNVIAVMQIGTTLNNQNIDTPSTRQVRIFPNIANLVYDKPLITPSLDVFL